MYESNEVNLEECTTYIIIRVDSYSYGIETNVVGVFRKKKEATFAFYKMQEEAKGALGVTYHLEQIYV